VNFKIQIWEKTAKKAEKISEMGCCQDKEKFQEKAEVLDQIDVKPCCITKMS